MLFTRFICLWQCIRGYTLLRSKSGDLNARRFLNSSIFQFFHWKKRPPCPFGRSTYQEYNAVRNVSWCRSSILFSPKISNCQRRVQQRQETHVGCHRSGLSSPKRARIRRRGRHTTSQISADRSQTSRRISCVIPAHVDPQWPSRSLNSLSVNLGTIGGPRHQLYSTLVWLRALLRLHVS